MGKYLLRLDDACEYRNLDKWCKIETLLDKYSIRPLVGIIPKCEDPALMLYHYDKDFWDLANRWKEKGWDIAMHGYNHVYSTKCGGINPINQKSEFAGMPLEDQKEKIRKGILIMKKHGIDPMYFFPPSHTFDKNTLIALKQESDIRIISDTIAWDCYCYEDFIFIPQQCGEVRKLPFKITTFCYHPNVMDAGAFKRLEYFLKRNSEKFVPIGSLDISTQKGKGILNQILWVSYVSARRLRHLLLRK